MNGKVNTINGEMKTAALGRTLCHEHVVCVSPFMCGAFGSDWVDTGRAADIAVDMLKQAKETCGIDTVIDGTPVDLGRDVKLIAEVSKRSGVNIIFSAGLYYSEDQFIANKRPELLAEPIIRECERGVLGSGVKPGILKCATGVAGVTQKNRITLETMAIVQRTTGLPLFAHNSHRDKTADAQLEVLRLGGADLNKVIVGHCSDCYDPDYLEGFLKKGCYLGFDRIYPERFVEQAATMSELISRGYEDKLLVSHDYYGCCDIGERINYGGDDGRNLTVVSKKLFPALKAAGVSEEQIDKLTRGNVYSLWS